MKRIYLLLLSLVALTAGAQTKLNKQSLVALSDVVGSREKSKTNIDVAEKDSKMIVSKTKTAAEDDF